MKTEKQLAIESLEPLFRQAEAEGLWFFSPYQQLWFSPKMLRARQAEGRFIWGACNWKLRDPMEEHQRLLKQAAQLVAEAADFKAAIEAQS